PMVGGGINDAIHIRTLQYFPVVLGGIKVLPPKFFGTGQSAIIKITGRHHFHPLNHEVSGGVTYSHSPGSDQCDTDAVIGGDVLSFYKWEVFGGLNFFMGQGYRDGSSDGCSGTKLFQEFSSGIFRCFFHKPFLYYCPLGDILLSLARLLLFYFID